MTRVLVLCVDRDDDIGVKAKIKGPIVGREKNLKAATALISVDPGESDANAIFEGIKTFDELKQEGVDIVTLSGHSSRGFSADKEISRQLSRVLARYKKKGEKIDGVYLVTDGADDDQVIPIIQSQIKILSKKTLIVKQAKELEKSYYVLKQVLRDPHFARIIFGLPGVILLVVAFLQDLGIKLIILLIGLYLMLKGFGIEDRFITWFRNFRDTTSIERASFPLYFGSVLTLILSIWAGIENVAKIGEASYMQIGAAFATGFITLFTISVILFFFGRIGDMSYRKETYKIRKYLMSIVTILAVWFVIIRATDLIFGTVSLDEFVLFVILAFLATVVGLTLVKVFYLKRYVTSHLKNGLEVYDTNGEKIGILVEIRRKQRCIFVENNKKQRVKIPFSRIVLAQDYVAARV